MSTALTLRTDHATGGAVVLAAVGEIDMSNAEVFATALAETRAAAGDAAFVVDLTAVEYLDSAGLAALFPHVEHLRLLAGPLLAPVLTVAGLADLTTVREG